MIRRPLLHLCLAGIALFIGVATSSMSAHATEAPHPISPWEYESIRDTTAQIEKTYALLQNPLYIGIGRSPTPIIAQMQNQNETKAITVPLSSFKHRTQETAKSITRGYNDARYNRLSHSEEKLLYSHFDHYIPSAAALGNRPIVMIDYGSTGETLLSAKEHLQKYFAQRGDPREINAAVLLWPDRADEISTLAKESGHTIEMIELKPRTPFASNIQLQRYDDAAQYGQFKLREQDLHVPIKKKPESPNYTVLRSQLLTRQAEARDRASSTQENIRTSAARSVSIKAKTFTNSERGLTLLRQRSLILDTQAPHVVGVLSKMASSDGISEEFLRTPGQIRIHPNHQLHAKVLEDLENPKSHLHEWIYLETHEWAQVREELAAVTGKTIFNWPNPLTMPKNPVIIRDEFGKAVLPCLPGVMSGVAR